MKQKRTFISSYQENISALCALDHDMSKESLFLTSYLLRKFDNDFRSKFKHSRVDSQKVKTIQELIEFIEKECSQLDLAKPLLYLLRLI